MGIAAYNRGNAVISRHLEDKTHPMTRSERYIVERVNSIPAGETQVFTETSVSRFDVFRRDHVLMNQQEKGWASAGLSFASLSGIRRRFALRLVWRDHDEHGPFWLWVREDVR